MRRQRARAAITATIVLGLICPTVLMATPAFADTDSEISQPIADATAETPVVVPEPSVPAAAEDEAPIEEAPIEIAPPSSVPATIPDPSTSPAIEPPNAPAVGTDPPVTQGPATPTPEGLNWATTSLVALSSTRPKPYETGYTNCWVTYPEIVGLDPYDARTWPSNTTCTPMTQQAIETKTTSIATNETTKRSVTNTWTTNAAGQSGVVHGDLTGDGHAGWTPIDANLSATPGDTVSVATTIELSVPARDTRPIIDRNGVPQPNADYTVDLRTGNEPTAIDPSFYNHDDANPELTTTRSCEATDTADVAGKMITIRCNSNTVIPKGFSFNQWNTYKGELSDISTFYSPEIRHVYPAFGGPGPWIKNPISSQISFRIDPAQEWLPSAKDQSFRVRVADTLTVTPEGLLTGTEWNQGDVKNLDTYITNIPKGGLVTSNGNLEFTSDQIGNYDFTYYVEDPLSGLRSQNAAGAIEVYAEAAAAPPQTPVRPPESDPVPPTIAPTTAILAYTGSDIVPSVLFALALLIAGVFATAAANHGRRRTLK